MNDTSMTRKTDPKYDDDLVNKRYVDRMLLDYCHPVGQIFITTNDNFNPNTMFGGTWEQITSDAYLKIVTSNGGSLGGTSSEHKIPLDSMPSHQHKVYRTGGSSSRFNVSMSWNNSMETTAGQGAVTGSEGGGQAYYPYYLGVYVWKRTG